MKAFKVFICRIVLKMCIPCIAVWMVWSFLSPENPDWTDWTDQNDAMEEDDTYTTTISRIFFMETSTTGILKTRQLPAVESAALWNPNVRVEVYVAVERGTFMTYSHDMKEISTVYPNVFFIETPLEVYLTGTVLEKWFASGMWRNSSYKMVHLSEALRYLELLKGGAYMDLDMLTLKELKLPKNCLMMESESMVAASMLVFQPNNAFVKELVRQFADDYKWYSGIGNGAALVTKTFMDPKNRHNFTDVSLLPMNTANPIVWVNGAKFFEENSTEHVLKVTRNSLAAHWWAAVNKGLLLSTTVNGFVKLLEKNSPVLYKVLKNSGWN